MAATDAAPAFDAHVLTIGISRYRHVWPLPVVSDAEDVAAVLGSPAHGGYPAANQRQLVDGAATRDAILAELDALATRTVDTSTVVVYFSGHGGEADGDCYLIPVDGRWATRDDLDRTAISGRQLTARLRAIRAARLTIMLDCCRAADLAEPKHIEVDLLAPGLSASTLAPLASGRGRAVLAAARGDGLSYVKAGDRNGVFTRHLLDGLRGAAGGTGGVIRICDLFHYVQQHVVAELPRQRPVFKAELEENFAIARYHGGAVPPLQLPVASDPYRYDAFVSYRRDDATDRRWVLDVLVPQLEHHGLQLCVEPRDFRIGAFRLREMERAVIESRYTVAVLTPAYLDGPFQEFQAVLSQHQAAESRSPRFIPVLRRDCRPSLAVRATEALDVSDDTTVAVDLQRLAVRLREPPHPILSS